MSDINRKEYNYGIYDCFRNSLRGALLIVSERGYSVEHAVDGYCISEYGIKASMGHVKYMLEAPVTIATHGCGKLVQSEVTYWEDVTNWIADVIISFIAMGVPTYEMIKRIKPSEIVKSFHPLHEMTMPALINRVSEEYGIDAPHRYDECFNSYNSPFKFLLGGE